MGRRKRSHLNLAIANVDRAVDLVALIKKCDDVNTPDADGNTPLHAAIQKGCIRKVIQALVAKGANLDAQDNELCTPLHLAFYCQAPKSVISFLIKCSENINIIDELKRTALHAAILTHRHQSILSMLIRKGANMEALDFRGRTPLHAAIDEGKDFGWYYRPFLKMTKNVNSWDSELKRTLLHAAIKSNMKPEIIQTLIEKGANLDVKDGQGSTPLLTAFECSYNPYDFELFEEEEIKIFLLLIKKTTYLNGVNKRGNLPLYYAFYERHYPVLIRALIENGAHFDFILFRFVAETEHLLPLLTETFPEELEDLKTIVVSGKTTLYDALVRGRPYDWNCVDRPLECLMERNKLLWGVIMSSIVAQRSYSLRLHSEGIRLDEDSTRHVISFLPCHDVTNLLLAYRHCLHLKRRSNSSVPHVVKRRKSVKV